MEGLFATFMTGMELRENCVYGGGGLNGMVIPLVYD